MTYLLVTFSDGSNLIVNLVEQLNYTKMVTLMESLTVTMGKMKADIISIETR